MTSRKPPKYLVSESGPLASDLLIVRTRNPFLVAYCEEMIYGAERLHLWPKQDPPLSMARLRTLLDVIGGEFGEEPVPVHNAELAEGTWTPPRWLLCSSTQARPDLEDFTWAVHTREPRCIFEFSDHPDGGIEGKLCLAVDDLTTAPQALARLAREAGDFVADYLKKEDEQEN